MEGFNDIVTGQVCRGFIDIVKELKERFPTPEHIEKEQDKKEFAKLFGEYLKAENFNAGFFAFYTLPLRWNNQALYLDYIHSQ
ncbi:hypothetical protein GCM10007290_04390 [Providencia stuartii]|nr:hypothetical protein GCM10007290_04390 [Providencia thailandensis]